MKTHLSKRLLSIMLAVVLCLSAAAPTAYAAESTDGTGLTIEQVSNDEVPLALDPSRAYVEQESDTYTAGGDVRVSIQLKQDATLDVYPVSTFAASSEALSYRQALRAEQDAVAQTISAQVLGGRQLDVVWHLTLAANIISANVAYDKLDDIRALPQV